MWQLVLLKFHDWQITETWALRHEAWYNDCSCFQNLKKVLNFKRWGNSINIIWEVHHSLKQFLSVLFKWPSNSDLWCDPIAVIILSVVINHICLKNRAIEKASFAYFSNSSLLSYFQEEAKTLLLFSELLLFIWCIRMVNDMCVLVKCVVVYVPYSPLFFVWDNLHLTLGEDLGYSQVFGLSYGYLKS